MSFNPKQEYLITEDKIRIRDFHEYAADYVTRPPYQRKSVWPRWKKQALIDSLFRRYYVPRLVMREVRLDDDRTVREIIDGQQRITAVQEFFADELALPKSMADIHPDLPGKTFTKLDTDLRRFIDKELVVSADVVKNIDDPRNADHQRVATEIFWRLQLGESLNTMEVEHAELSSVARNFIVKYADDITFDFENYRPVDRNSDKHPFFRLVARSNQRMQHLLLLARLLLIEESEGYTDLRDKQISSFIAKYKREDGIGSDAFETQPCAKRCLAVLNLTYEVFKDDPIHADGTPIKEFRREYLIISFYVLLCHLRQYYVIDQAIKDAIQKFYHWFWNRWHNAKADDHDVISFSNSRQQDAASLRERDIIMRQLFFEYLREHNISIIALDTKRAFSEAERIKLYRRDNGICKQCLAEGRNEREARVEWTEFQADHVLPHARGGRTVIENGCVLCAYHNAQKGASFPASSR